MNCKAENIVWKQLAGSSQFSIQFDRIIDSILIGDINGDGFANLLNVTPFVRLLSGSVFNLNADRNQYGVVELLDVVPIVALLTG